LLLLLQTTQVPLVVDIETSDDEHPGDGGSTEESDSGLGSSDDDSGMDSSGVQQEGEEEVVKHK
jgi:hypothetical protein